MKNVKNWLRKYYLRITCVSMYLAMVLFQVPTAFEAVELFRQHVANQTREKMLDLPRARHDELANSMANFKAIFSYEPKNLEDFFRMQRWLEMQQTLCQKYIKEWWGDVGAMGLYDPPDIKNQLTALAAKEQELSRLMDLRYGPKEVQRARKAYDLREPEGYWHPPIPLDLTWLSIKAVSGYLFAVLFSGIYFIPKARLKEFRLRYEWTPLRLPLAMSLFFMMAAVYPRGEPKERVKQVLRFVASFASFLLVTIIPGASSAFAKSKRLKRHTTDYAFVCNSAQAPPLPTEIVVPQQTAAKNTTPPAADKCLTFNASAGYFPFYDGLDGFVFSDHPVMQGQWGVNLPTGFYFGNWYSVSLQTHNRPSPNFGNELDTFAGFTFSLAHLKFDSTATYVTASPLLRIPAGDVAHFRVGASKPIHLGSQTLTPQMSFRYNTPVKGNSPGRGSFLRMGINHSWHKHDLQLDSAAEILHDSGAFGFSSANIMRLNTTASWKIRKWLSFQFPIVNFTAPLGTIHDSRKPEFLIGFGFAH